MKIGNSIKSTSIAVFIIISILMCSYPAYALDDTATVDGGFIRVEGKTDSREAGERITVIVLKKDKTADDLFNLTDYSAIGTIVANVKGATTTAGGNYSALARIDETFEVGDYNIIVDGEGMTEPKLMSVFCISLSTIRNSIDLLNNSTEADATLTIQENAQIFGLNLDDYNNKLSDDERAFVNRRIIGKNYSNENIVATLQSIVNEFNIGIGLRLLNKAVSVAEVKYVINNYNQNLNLNLDVFNKYDDNVSVLCEKLYPLDISDIATLQETFKRESVINFLKIVTLTGAVKEVIEDYSGDIGFDISIGSEYRNVDSFKLYKNFMGKRDFIDYAGVKSAMNVAIAASKETVVKPSGNGGGGGISRNESFSVGEVAVLPLPTPPVTITAEFEDTNGHWAKDDINYMFSKGYINGLNEKTYAPDVSISRAQFISIIVRILGLTQEQENVYTDLLNEWYEVDVNKAAKAGLISTQSSEFRPEDPITREELMKIVINAYKFKKNDYIAKQQQLTFADNDKVSDWAIEFVSSAVDLEFVKGVEKNGAIYIQPTNNTTRAEATTILRRLVDKIN